MNVELLFYFDREIIDVVMFLHIEINLLRLVLIIIMCTRFVYEFFLCLKPFPFAFFRACYGVLRFVMESGAKGCEVCSLVEFELIFLV